MPPSSPLHPYMSNYQMATSSVPLAQLPSIGQAYHTVPHRLMSFPNSTHTPSFPSASSVTTIALIFDKHNVTIEHNNHRILHGPCLPNGPWSLPLHSPQPQANTLIPADTQKDLVQWLHATAFSPSISTFLDAVEHNFFTTWPNLTPPPPPPKLSITTCDSYCNRKRALRPTMPMTMKTHRQ